MAHLAYISIGMGSTVGGTLELCRRFRSSGHQVTVVSHADVGTKFSAHGFQFEQLTADREFRRLAAAAPPPWQGSSGFAPGGLVRWLKHRRDIRRQSIDNREIEVLLKRLAPDFVLFDIEMHFAIIVSARLGIPSAVAIFWFSVFRRPGLPPLHTSLKPGASWRERTAIRFAWWRTAVGAVAAEWRTRFGPARFSRAVQPVPYNTVDAHDLRAVARSRGFDLGRETTRWQWLRPYMYTRMPVICYNAKEMDLPHTQDSRLHYVGPMVAPSLGGRPIPEEAALRWEQLKHRRATESESRRPLIYCSVGTFQAGHAGDRSFLQQVLQVFDRRPDWDLVIGLGGKLKAEELSPVPPNAIVMEWAPQLDVLQLADCALTHAGIGSINECVFFDVPLVVYSAKRLDQEGCAVRVEYHGLGIRAEKEADGTERIARNIDRALTDATIRANVSAMREVFLAYRETNAVVKAVEQLAGISSTGHGSGSP